jgi:MFS family permease
VLIPAFAGLALTTALLGQVSTALGFIVVLGALGVASAYSGVPPAPMLSDVTPEELKGTAVGVFRFVGDLGFVLGPLIAGWSVTALPALVAVGLVVSIKETMKSRGR